jgi:hypothetical protein
MRTTLWCVMVVALAGCAANSDDGSECQFGPDPCGGDDVCVDGECVAPDSLPPDAPRPDDYKITVEPERDTLKADRTDTLVVRIEVKYSDPKRKAFKGKVLVRANPFDAAMFDPVEVDVKGGLGGTHVRGCDPHHDLLCPDAFRIDVALPDYPTLVLGHSGLVHLEGDTPAPSSAAQ